MKIRSCNTGTPQVYEFEGAQVQTSMVRTPQSKIWIGKTQVQGDKFDASSVHGVVEAVVYTLSTESYSRWAGLLGREIPLGFFGENLSVEGLNEAEFFVDDIWQAGTARLRVTGPRYPCNRLNFVTKRSDMRDLFVEKAWPGVYFTVLTEGEVRSDQELTLESRVQAELSVQDIFLALQALERKLPKNIHVERALNYEPLWSRFKDRLRAYYG